MNIIDSPSFSNNFNNIIFSGGNNKKSSSDVSKPSTALSEKRPKLILQSKDIKSISLK